MRLATRLAVDPDRARALLADVDAWPTWMPGVRRWVPAGERGGARLADVEQELHGHVMRQRLAVTVAGEAVTVVFFSISRTLTDHG